MSLLIDNSEIVEQRYKVDVVDMKLINDMQGDGG